MELFKYKIILAPLVMSIALCLTGCEKDFLETSPSSSISDTEAFKTTQGAQTALNGLYFHLRRYNGGGANRMDDHGIPSLIMTNDAAAGQEIVVWGGWYSYDYSLWGHTRGDIFKASSIWTFLYVAVNNANLIISNIDNASGSDEDKAAIKAQAMAIRAYAYFYLIRYFQQTYIIAKDLPGVPIYLEPATPETSGNGRGTVQQTYDQILSDLTTAIPLLENYDRAGRKTVIDKNVANGILAEVYLTMNRWDEAAKAAHAAREGYNLMSPADFQAGFNDINNEEWMWGALQTLDQNMSDYSPFAMWANWTRNGFTFQCFFLNDVFARTFDPQDIRFANQIELGPDWGNGLYISYKFRDTPDLIGDIVMMRASSMWLIEAEALARDNFDDQAKSILWELQDARNAERTEATGAELIDAILLERRKELYGEGYSWFDMIRTLKPMYRSGVHMDGKTPIEGIELWPARSWRYVYQIPFNEMSNNKALNQETWPAGDQTPFDGQYNP